MKAADRKPATGGRKMRGEVEGDERAPRAGRVWRIVGVLLLLLAAGSSAFLVYQHFGGRIPGCGPTAACAQLQHSKWGKLPWIGWPVAFAGFSYFIAMAAGLGVSAAWRRSPLVPLAWLGALGSLGLAALMVYLGKVCVYCGVTHALNLLFVACMWMELRSERAAARREGAAVMRVSPIRSYVVFLGVFGVTTGALGVARGVHEAEMARAAEKEREESAQRIIEQGRGGASEQPADRWGAAGFTGRYRRGPAEAALRIVVLTDYQCPDCRRVEAEIEEVLRERKDASLSVKHFPMCLDCNKYAGRTLHQNACWAARAAEAAGILGGDEAFFKMHDWLFENKGHFLTQEQLAPGIAAAGLDPAVFTAVMQGVQTLKNVQADIEDGMALGIFSTPMIFINGVEFKGWHVPGAFKKTIEQVAATNPPARTAAADRPVLAMQRYVDDWKASPKITLAPDKTAWSMGAASGAAVEVVVWGDYQEENTIKVNAQIVEALKGRTDTRYTFRHYPVDPSCNTALPAGVPAASIHPLACKAAKAAEAAGAVAGSDGYWKMHQWLMENWRGMSDASIEKAAKDLGFDVERFKSAMGSAEVTAAIVEDCNAAKMAGLTRVPYVFVNGKVVPRVLREGENVMKRIVEEAGRK